METRAVAGTTRVLVADDNLVVRRLLVVNLRAAGCRVTEATDGLDALEQFRKQPAAERVVRATAAAPLPAGQRRVDVTCSAGVSVLAADDGACGSALVARSDAALYAAKRAGRNRAVAFDDPAPVEAPANMALQARAC